jgi:ABC-type lipoprotein release transport system permease subunit
MQPLAFKMLFRKKGTASAIIAIALLIALLTSVNSLLNNINAETSALTTLSNVGQNYLITSKNSSSLFDSQIDSNLTNQVRNDSNINYATSQQLTQGILKTKDGNYTVNIRAVNDLQAYLGNRGAYVNGSISKNESETNMGIVISQLTSTNKNDPVNLTINNQSTQLKVVGIVQANQQSDAELIMPLTNLQALTQETGTVSFCEFSLKDSRTANMTLSTITQTLPNDIKIIKLTQAAEFAQAINNQTINFINVWSITIYMVVIAAAYVLATRLVNEAKYELYILRTLGTKKKATLSLIVTYTLTIVFVGSAIGIAIGLVGTQMAATGVRWFWGNSQLAPFLQPEQALQILLLALVSSLIGGIYPALRATKDAAKEAPL